MSVFITRFCPMFCLFEHKSVYWCYFNSSIVHLYRLQNSHAWYNPCIHRRFMQTFCSWNMTHSMMDSPFQEAWTKTLKYAYWCWVRIIKFESRNNERKKKAHTQSENDWKHAISEWFRWRKKQQHKRLALLSFLLGLCFRCRDSENEMLKTFGK